jgi:hypothetical protein
LDARSGGLIRAILGNVHEQAWKNHRWFLAAALPAERRVLARRGWAGEKVVFLSILWECSPVVPLVRTFEVLARIAPYPEAKPPGPMIVYISLSSSER